VARYFVSYLRADYPEICRLSQLRRDPHMLGFFRWLCELRPPIGNPTRRQRLLCLRRLLNDLADQGHHLQPGLIIREDFPALPEYLPRPLSRMMTGAFKTNYAAKMTYILMLSC
jgi:hypothetical protein